jgi:hypothetical protein
VAGSQAGRVLTGVASHVLLCWAWLAADRLLRSARHTCTPPPQLCLVAPRRAAPNALAVLTTAYTSVLLQRTVLSLQGHALPGC